MEYIYELKDIGKQYTTGFIKNEQKIQNTYNKPTMCNVFYINYVFLRLKIFRPFLKI